MSAREITAGPKPLSNLDRQTIMCSLLRLRQITSTRVLSKSALSNLVAKDFKYVDGDKILDNDKKLHLYFVKEFLLNFGNQD